MSLPGRVREMLGIFAMRAIRVPTTPPLTAGFFTPKDRGDSRLSCYLDGTGVYISGDTRQGTHGKCGRSKNIESGLVCMNLPFTMDAEQAAEAVRRIRAGHGYSLAY